MASAQAVAQSLAAAPVPSLPSTGTRQRKGRQAASRTSSEAGGTIDPANSVPPSPRAVRTSRRSSRLEAGALSHSVDVSQSHPSNNEAEHETPLRPDSGPGGLPEVKEDEAGPVKEQGEELLSLQGLWRHPARPYVAFVLLGIVTLGLCWAVLGSGSGLDQAVAREEGKALKAVQSLQAKVDKTTKAMQLQVDVLGKKEQEIKGAVRKLASDVETRLKALGGDLDVIKTKAEDVEAALSKLAAEGTVVSRAEVLDLARSVVNERAGSEGGSAFSLDDVRSAARRVVLEELEVFGADRLGRPDFALGSAGGKVVAHSEAVQVPGSGLGLLGFLGAGLHPFAQNLLRPYNGEPGNCLPLKGANGTVDLALLQTIVPTAVTLEHVSKLNAYDMSSAPRLFRILGWQRAVGSSRAEPPQQLGEFAYDAQGPLAIQTFPVTENAVSPVNMIRLQLLSNHGHSLYTCLYRLRVHGTPAAS